MKDTGQSARTLLLIPKSQHKLTTYDIALALLPVQKHMRQKHILVVCVGKDLIEKTEKLGFSVSKTL
jgi:hypothetical protein